MSLKAEKLYIFVDEAGNSHTLAENHPVKQACNVKIVCDGPKCASRNNPVNTENPLPVTYAWKEEEAVADPLSLIPDGVARIISAEFERGAGAKTFCGPRCLTDYLRDVYVPPLSPREVAEQEKKRVLVDVSKSVHLVDSAESASGDQDRSLN